MQENNIEIIGDLYEENGYGSQGGRVYGTDSVSPAMGASHFNQVKYITEVKKYLTGEENKECLSRAEQSRAEQSRAEQSRAEQLNYPHPSSNETGIHRSRTTCLGRSQLPGQPNEERSSTGERTDMSNTSDGEYP